MITGTTARVSHYHVQKQRRAEFMSLWRANQRAVIHVDDVVLSDTARGSRQGVYLGAEGGRPTRTMDVWVHEIEPGAETTVHRHSWDALVLCVGGWAWTEVDGQRISWGPGDSLHLPAWAWHRHGNEGDRTARFLSFSCEPLLETMGMAILQEAGRAPARDLPGRPSSTSGVKGDGSYELRVRRLAGQRHTARLHTSWDDLEMLPTPRGTRSTFLVDRSIDYQTSGLTMALFEIAPGRAQSMHRHPGEAWLYVLDGRGYSYLGAEPEGGIVHAWKKGDLIVVDHFLWHQHFLDFRPLRGRHGPSALDFEDL